MNASTPNNSVTLGLSGIVPARLYAHAIQHFNGLVGALTTEVVRKNAFEWFVDDDNRGSTTTTLLAEPKDQEDVEHIEHVVSAYATVGRSLEYRERIPYSSKVTKEAEEIASILNGRIVAVRFETAEADSTIVSATTDKPTVRAYHNAYGAVEGRVQTLTSRRGWRFTLYDSLYDRGVTCYLTPEQEDMMRGVWGHRTLVEGWISRDVISGHPINIRRIRHIEVLDDVVPGSYKLARGALRDGMSHEEVSALIQRVNNAW